MNIIANRPHPAHGLRSFEQNDDRIKFSIYPNQFDCRIHFALNCGARGCPPISFYTPANLKKGLEMASANFCSGETEIDLEKEKITFSRIFLWYKTDFICQNENDLKEIKNNEDELLIRYIASQIREDDEKYTLLKDILKSDKLNKIKVNYLNH